MFFSKKMFSSDKAISGERIKDYEYGISRWYDAAEELFPHYYEMNRKQRHALKAKIKTRKSGSIDSLFSYGNGHYF